MLYLYSKQNGQLLSTENFVVIAPNVIELLKKQFANEIRNNYGEIAINPKTYTPYFKYYEVDIIVDSENNPHLASEGEEGITVKKKDYYKAKDEMLKGKVMKFYNGEFHLFTADPIKDYVPSDNTWVLNVNKYRDVLLDKIRNSEQEIREHGYYYTFWDESPEMYVQPFRVVPDNDYQAINQVKELPRSHRALKLFTVKDGKRQTAVGTFKWIKGAAVNDEFLRYISSMITSYSNYVKDGIYQMVQYTATVNDINVLKNINDNYVSLILNNIHKKLYEIEDVKVATAKIKTLFKQYGIKPITDNVL